MIGSIVSGLIVLIIAGIASLELLKHTKPKKFKKVLRAVEKIFVASGMRFFYSALSVFILAICSIGGSLVFHSMNVKDFSPALCIAASLLVFSSSLPAVYKLMQVVYSPDLRKL